MSNFIDGKGNIVNVPTEYKEMPVKTKKGVRNGVEIVDNVVYVDEDRISKDYNEKLFAAESEAADSYSARGLRPFRAAENVFPTKSSFFKYVVEREYQRSMIPLSDAMKNKTFRNLRNVLKSSIKDINTLNLQTYEAFLNQRAMIFAFNREALMQTVNYSYSDQLMGLIREFSDLKDKYPVLNQLTKPSLKTGEKVISLNDSRMLKDPQLAEIYYQNIKDLGDPTVKKVALESDNERISEMFGILPLVAIYQHGIGYSRFGFNEALPYDKFLDVMDSASQIFLEKQLNNATLRNIYDKLMDPKNKLFKDFVVSPEDFNNPTDTPLEPEVATEETDVEEEVITTPESKIISDAYGVVVAETNPSISKTKEFVDIIQPQIQAQAYKENNSGTANDMFMYGLRWTRKSKAKVPLNNRSYANKGLLITDAKATDGYVYDTVDQNGKTLAPVSDLQPIINEIQNAIGIDMSNYDAVIGNIYLPGQNIATHRDTTESLSARNYPVLVYTIGNNSGIGIYEDKTNPGAPTFASDARKNIPTKNGTIYTFGMDGKGRFELAHDTPKGIKRDQKFPPIKLPNGTVVENYTITLTFRRAADLEPGMPTTPFKKGTAPTQPAAPIAITTASEYTNHSGGAIGSDTQWDVIGKEFGMVNNRHYYTGEKGPKNAPLGNVDITNKSIAVEGASKVAQAAKQMWGYKYNTMKDQRLIRNWAQVANSDAVFAIGKLGEEGDIWKGDEKSTEPRRLLKAAVQGGTGYAVEMAIQAGKPVYVFDLVDNVWMKYNPEGLIDTDIPGAKGRFEQIDTPVLTKNFAGIGTREINEAGKQAIRDVYVNTFKPTTQPSTNVKGKFSALPGTSLFTLNQRLEIINRLFEGSSDEFAKAYNRFNNVESLNEFTDIFNELSEKYNWNALEDKNDKEAYDIFYSTIYNDLLKVLPTQEQPDQNAPDGLPPIDRSIDSCS